jgi:hypothetical protein
MTYVIVPLEPTDKMVEAARSVMASWHNIPGSGLTVAREKAKIRYRAMVKASPYRELIMPNISPDGMKLTTKLNGLASMYRICGLPETEEFILMASALILEQESEIASLKAKIMTKEQEQNALPS